MKKRGFSLAELMIFMLFVSLVMAASAPMITKKVKELPQKNAHGMYICYRDANNNLRQALYSSKTLINSSLVNACQFTPPTAARLFKIELIGGGAGGYSDYYRKAELGNNNDSVTFNPRDTHDNNKRVFDNAGLGNVYPTNEIIASLYNGETVSMQVSTAEGGKSGTHEYLSMPITGLTCSLHKMSSKNIDNLSNEEKFKHYFTTTDRGRDVELDDSCEEDIGTYKLYSGVNVVINKYHYNMQKTTSDYGCNFSSENFTYNKKGPQGFYVYTNDTSSSAVSTYNKLFANFNESYSDPMTKLFNAFLFNDSIIEGEYSYTVDQRIKMLEDYMKKVEAEKKAKYNSAAVTFLPDDERSKNAMNWFCYEKYLYSDYDLAHTYTYSNRPPLCYIEAPIDNSGNKAKIYKIVDKAYSWRLITDNMLGNVYATSEYFIASDPGWDWKNLAMDFEGVDIDGNRVWDFEYGLISSNMLYFKKDIHTYNTPLSTTLASAKGGKKAYLSYSDTIDFLTNSNAETELRNYLNSLSHGSCTTAGCNYGNNFTANLFPKDGADGKNYSAMGTSDSSEAKKYPAVPEDYSGGSVMEFAALRVSNSYATYDKTPTGGEVAIVDYTFPNNLVDEQGIYPINITPAKEGESPSNIVCNTGDFCDAFRNTRLFNTRENHIQYPPNMTVRAILSRTFLNAGNGGGAGQRKIFKVTNIPEPCTFTIGVGGQAIDKDTTLDQRRAIENSLNTTMTCGVGDGWEWSAQGGKYNFEFNSSQFDSNTVGDDVEKYEWQGEAAGVSPFSQSIFVRYNMPNDFRPGKGGDPAKIIDSYVTGYSEIEYTVGNNSIRFDNELEDFNYDDYVEEISAGNGRGGAVIITW